MKVQDIGLGDQMIFTMKDSPAAQNRYIYYPDHLVRLPTPVRGAGLMQNIGNVVRALFKEPLLKPLLPALLFEHSKPARMPDQWQTDESVSSFISRRFNSQVADNLVSAVIHGIYAGDIDQLSAQALFGPIRNLEHSGVLYGLITNAARTRSVDDHLIFSKMKSDEFARMRTQSETEREARRRFNLGFAALLGLAELNPGASTFVFKDGTQQLANGLVSALKKSEKVNIRTQTNVEAISHYPGSYHPMNVRRFCSLRLDHQFHPSSHFSDLNLRRPKNLRPCYCHNPCPCAGENPRHAAHPRGSPSFQPEAAKRYAPATQVIQLCHHGDGYQPLLFEPRSSSRQRFRVSHSPLDSG